jgi:hypothetical protein
MISQVTSRPAAAQHLRDLARLRRVRDRIDREYAQPLDVEALAGGGHMSATADLDGTSSGCRPEDSLEVCRYEDSGHLLAPAMDPERVSADDFLLGGVGRGESLHRRER